MKPKQAKPIITAIALFVAMIACGDLKENGKDPLDTNPNEPVPIQSEMPLSFTLGTAANFVVLAGSQIIIQDTSSINGNVGISPGKTVTGLTSNVLNGKQHINDADGLAKTAQKDLAAAYKNGNALSSTTIVSLKENLGGLTLIPGLYQSTSAIDISSGNLTFDGKGDSSSIFIIQIPSTLSIASGSKVMLTNNAKAKNIFWLVGTTATLAKNSHLQGSILAEESITLEKGALLYGRALSKSGTVKLVAGKIIAP